MSSNRHLFFSGGEDDATCSERWRGCGKDVVVVAIGPLFPANILAGTKGDAVYTSYDGGQLWVSRRAGLHEVTISLVVHQ